MVIQLTIDINKMMGEDFLLSNLKEKKLLEAGKHMNMLVKTISLIKILNLELFLLL